MMSHEGSWKEVYQREMMERPCCPFCDHEKGMRYDHCGCCGLMMHDWWYYDFRHIENHKCGDFIIINDIKSDADTDWEIFKKNKKWAIKENQRENSNGKVIIWTIRDEQDAFCQNNLHICNLIKEKKAVTRCISDRTKS